MSADAGQRGNAGAGSAQVLDSPRPGRAPAHTMRSRRTKASKPPIAAASGTAASSRSPGTSKPSISGSPAMYQENGDTAFIQPASTVGPMASNMKASTASPAACLLYTSPSPRDGL